MGLGSGVMGPGKKGAYRFEGLLLGLSNGCSCVHRGPNPMSLNGFPNLVFSSLFVRPRWEPSAVPPPPEAVKLVGSHSSEQRLLTTK